MEEASESKIYVGNLPFSVTQEKLKELFAPYGEITEATVIADKFSGRSKGFGFVTFVKKEDAKKAVAEMSDKARAVFGMIIRRSSKLYHPIQIVFPCRRSPLCA